jgi:hypothetical protein
MTFEHKIVVGLNDVKAVIYECLNKNCGARVIASPDTVQIPKQCPSCNEGWLSGEQTSRQSDTSQEKNFVEALRQLRILGTKPLPFRILLEYDITPSSPVASLHG